MLTRRPGQFVPGVVERLIAEGEFLHRCEAVVIGHPHRDQPIEMCHALFAVELYFRQLRMTAAVAGDKAVHLFHAVLKARCLLQGGTAACVHYAP